MENQGMQTEVRRGRGRPAKYTYPFENMEVNDVAEVPLRRQKIKPIRDRIAVAAHLYSKRHDGVRFKVSRKKGDQVIKVIRIS